MKYIGVALLAGFLVVAGYLVRKPTVITERVDGTRTIVGAVTGPDIASPYFSFGGVRHWGYSQDIRQGTTTVCSFQSPVSTSTLDIGSVQVTTGTSSVISVEIAKDNPRTLGNTGMTTRLGYLVTTDSQKFTLLASTTMPTGVVGAIDTNTNWIFGPSNYLNVKIGGFLGTTNVLVGTCKAVFVEN